MMTPELSESKIWTSYQTEKEGNQNSRLAVELNVPNKIQIVTARLEERNSLAGYNSENSWQVIDVISGTGEAEIGKERKSITKSSLVVIEPGKWFNINADKGEVLTLKIVCSPPFYPLIESSKEEASRSNEYLTGFSLKSKLIIVSETIK